MGGFRPSLLTAASSAAPATAAVTVCGRNGHGNLATLGVPRRSRDANPSSRSPVPCELPRLHGWAGRLTLPDSRFPHRSPGPGRASQGPARPAPVSWPMTHRIPAWDRKDHSKWKFAPAFGNGVPEESVRGLKATLLNDTIHVDGEEPALPLPPPSLPLLPLPSPLLPSLSSISLSAASGG